MRTKRIDKTRLTFLLPILALVLLGAHQTAASFSDTETSQGNVVQAASLDISVTASDWVQDATDLLPGDSVSRTMTVMNDGSLDAQIDASTAISGDTDFCDALTVSPLSPPTVSSGTSVALTLTVALPTGVLFDGKTCHFTTTFLAKPVGAPPVGGFFDEETVDSIIRSAAATPTLRSPRDGAVINGAHVEQAWLPVTGATAYKYQSCNNDPDTGPCNVRWEGTYPTGSPQFTQTMKWANGVANATYWWRVKAVIGTLESPWSDAWKIIVDNAHQNSVVLNEVLPNPNGDDDAPMPGGEWVELYNNTGSDIDVGGWFIYDSDNAHELEIVGTRTDTEATLIHSGDYLVVYKNVEGDFTLNDDGDTVRLFTDRIGAGGTLIDSFTYSYPGGKPEDWSYARVPDGSNTWVDPVPTPGEPNVVGDEELVPVEEQEQLEFELPALTASVSGDFAEIASPSEGIVVVATGSEDPFSGTASDSEGFDGSLQDGTDGDTSDDSAAGDQPSDDADADKVSPSDTAPAVPPDDDHDASTAGADQEQVVITSASGETGSDTIGGAGDAGTSASDSMSDSQSSTE